MTVSAHPRDAAGASVQAAITALTTKLTITSSAGAVNQMNVKLDQLQRELVAHYMNVGRITAAGILSTMT